MRVPELPYDVWELILPMLDGLALLAASCVCTTWHERCTAYLARQPPTYWRNRCLEELSKTNLTLCLSGEFEENWFAVYKSSCLHNTLRSRRVRSTHIPLVKRFEKLPVSMHVLGHMLVIVQGPLILAYDVMTGTRLGEQHLNNFNVFDSFVVKKCGVESIGSTKSGSLECDVLVITVGGRKASHIAVVNADTLLETRPAMVPWNPPSVEQLNTSRPVNGSWSRYMECKKYNNHLACGERCIEITVSRRQGISLQTIRCTGSGSVPFIRVTDAEYSKYSVSWLSANVVVSDTSGDDSTDAVEIVVSSHCGEKVYTTIPVDGKLQPTKSGGRCDSARIIHVGDETVPVVASLQTNEVYGKHVMLYTLPHD